MKNGNSPALFPEMVSKGGGDGILPCQEIKQMVAIGQVSAFPEVPDSQIQPASIDLRLGPMAYRVPASFLRGRSATFMTRVEEFVEEEINLTQPNPALLDPGKVYIIPLVERLNLPNDIHGVANPKSTTGRLDIFTRLITEHGDQFDRVPKGYKGMLFVEVSPLTFSIRVRYLMKLNQLRFVRGTRANDAIRNGDLKEIAEEYPLVYSSSGEPCSGGIDDGVEITVDLEGAGVVAYKAKTDRPRTVELDKFNYYDPEDYWEPIAPRHGHITLAKGGFYLLASKQLVSVPLHLAAEMTERDATMGEFRVHYAGFFDPGFGYGGRAGDIRGTKAVLEVRAYEVPIILEDNHVIGTLNYYQMADIPAKAYGESGLNSSYQKQGLALSKQFKRLDLEEPELVSSQPEQSARL